MNREIEISKITRAKQLWQNILSVEKDAKRAFEDIKVYGYELGRVLTELKSDIGHGKWLIYLCAKLPELGGTDGSRIRQAQRFMDFFERQSKAKKFSHLKDGEWDAEAERKLMFGYVPAKERTAIEGDEKDSLVPHHLTWINNFYKWDRQIQIGQAQFPHISVLQHELEQPFRRIVEICGREWACKTLGIEPTGGSSPTATRTYYSGEHFSTATQ